MEISDIFKDAFKFPASNWNRFLILGIIILASTLLAMPTIYFKNNPYILLTFLIAYIIQLFIMGYTLRTIKISINGEDELPAFNKWIEMFIDGIKIFIISLLYSIIPSIFIIIGVFIAVFSSIHTGNLQLNFLNPATLVFLAIGGLLYILVMFFYQIGIANMAYHGKLEAALRLSEIRNIIRKIGWKKYLAVFIILIIISGASSVFGYFLNRMPVYLPIIFAILISPYLGLFRSRSLGLIYKEAL
ncbi:MAG TPA: DUF4013 domain-containing protein [Methanobacterium sp.]|nr:DUF4013 domain-containing protein [Methanobacterium sp.]